MVGPKIGFRGNAILHSFNKNLEYNGFFKGIHQLPLPRTDWFRSSATINPDSIFIPLTTPITNLNRQTLNNGFYVSNDSTHVYSTLFSRKRNTSDQELLKCEGIFTYNEKFDEFRIGSIEKIYGLERRGNFMAMSEQKKIIYGEGKFNFGLETPGYNVKAGGYATLNLGDTTFNMKMSMSIDMILPNQAIKMMYDSLNEQSAAASSNFFDEKVLRYSIPNMVEDKTFKKLGDNMEDELGSKNLEELQKMFFITDLQFTWDQSRRAFTNASGDFGLRSIDKYLVERRISGKVEIVKKRGGDEMTIYLQQPNTWKVSQTDFDFNTDAEPNLVFKKVDIFCITPGDTFELYQTSGKFYTTKNIWMGKGGKVDWSRVGLDSSRVYAIIKNYKIELSDGLLEADSSLFYNKDLQAKPMLGKVIDKPMGKSQGDKSIYPQFEGYFSEFTGVTYGKAKFKGGFGMRGALVIGKGNTDRKAELWFSFKNKPFLRIQSPEFYVRENKISVEKAEVTIFLDKDSIYHPQLAFNYLISKPLKKILRF